MEVMVMTITADHVSVPIKKTDDDRGPGSSDVAWAERAYKHEQRQPANERRRGPRTSRRQLRMLVAALVVLLMVGLIVVMRFLGSAATTVVHRPISSQTVTAPRATIAPSPFTLTPPMDNPFPSLSPMVQTPKR
jgi:hypothetical protein